eukprot:4633813-Prymnesium_polylepis.1
MPDTQGVGGEEGLSHQASGIRHQASGIGHQASGIRHQASSIKHHASRIRHPPTHLRERVQCGCHPLRLLRSTRTARTTRGATNVEGRWRLSGSGCGTRLGPRRG